MPRPNVCLESQVWILLLLHIGNGVKIYSHLNPIFFIFPMSTMMYAILKGTFKDKKIQTEKNILYCNFIKCLAPLLHGYFLCTSNSPWKFCKIKPAKDWNLVFLIQKNIHFPLFLNLFIPSPLSFSKRVKLSEAQS